MDKLDSYLMSDQTGVRKEIEETDSPAAEDCDLYADLENDKDDTLLASQQSGSSVGKNSPVKKKMLEICQDHGDIEDVDLYNDLNVVDRQIAAEEVTISF